MVQVRSCKTLTQAKESDFMMESLNSSATSSRAIWVPFYLPIMVEVNDFRRYITRKLRYVPSEIQKNAVSVCKNLHLIYLHDSCILQSASRLISLKDFF